MFFNQDIVKNFVNNNVITSHIVGNGNTIINGNNVNSKSREVAKKHELSKEYLHLSLKEAVSKPDIVFRTETEKLFLPIYADKKEYRKVLASILASCALVLFLIGSVFTAYLTSHLSPNDSFLSLFGIFSIAFPFYFLVFSEMGIRSVEFHKTEYFSKKDLLLVKEFCPEEESLWMQAIKQAILDDNEAAEKYARNVLTLADKRKKVAQKKESSKWEELSTQKEIQAGFEEDIV